MSCWYGLVLAVMFMQVVSGQVVASGLTLTVTTNNAVAVFQGPDLVGFTNIATGESYLKSAATLPLTNLEVMGTPASLVQGQSWSTSTQAGVTVGVFTLTDSVNKIILTVSVDSTSQEIVVNVAAQATQAGISAAYWGVDGIDVSNGHLVIPANSGIVLDQQHVQIGARMQYPSDWMAQMVVYETTVGSMLLYSTDSQYSFKQLRVGSHAPRTLDLSIATQPNGPFSSATSVPATEWRLKAFVGDWRTAAGVYRDWLAVKRPPVSNAAHPWVKNIQTVVQMEPLDTTILTTLASVVTPSKTLLYLVNWRLTGYDVNYPDYTAAAGVAAYVAQAHTLGFKVMLHTDLIGVTPSNADFAGVRQWQVRDPLSLALQGWEWNKPAGTQNRFAYINPAASAYRKLFIDRVGVAVAAVQPDALHLDISAPMMNDGNGSIEGMNYPQGVAQLHRDLIAAFPSVALGGEGTNDILYAYDSFAQNWWAGGEPSDFQGHPIANFLWNSQGTGKQVQYYGHLGQPPASDPGFVKYASIMEQEGFPPALAINAATDLDLTNADNARFLGWLKTWQTSAFQPNWTGTWPSTLLPGVAIPYIGTGGAVGALSDTGTTISLDAGGATVYRRIHHTGEFASSTGFIRNWPAFDAGQIYGLDPLAEYWLDSISRPVSSHVGSLLPGIQVGPDTMLSSNFALVQLKASQPYDFEGNVLAATSGITYNGADSQLGFGGAAQAYTIASGNVSRPAIFIQPPFQPGRSGGETFVEWPVPVPAASALTFSVGIADFAGTCTDGMTFRVALDGVEVWRRNVQVGGWVNGSVDLTRYGGATVRVRIISNPGPAKNSNCDYGAFSNLGFTALISATTSVPMVLSTSATAAVLSGSGSLSVTGANAATVSGVPLPGKFVLFTGPGTPVSVGGNLASLPFLASLTATGQIAVPGSIYGSGSIGTAFSGGVSKQNAIFGHPPNYGSTTLSWSLAIPSTGSLQFGWSIGMGDGSLSDSGVQFSVRINGDTYWTMFQQTPSGWKAGSLDLSGWRGKNILLQLVTDSVGDDTYDWGWWTDLNFTQSSSNCSYTLPAGVNVPAGDSQGTVSISAGAGCPWATQTDVPWISVAAVSAGQGSGSIPFTVQANTGAARTGTISVAGKSYAISQATGLVGATALRFIATTPCRIADTRNASGALGGPAIAGGTFRDFAIQSSACGIPASAQAYSFNVAVVPQGPLGYLTMWPAGQTQPFVATLNSDGRIKSNAAIVPAGTGGAVSVFASNPTHVVIDINGYFVPAANPGALAFYPLTPCRVSDTRNGNGSLGGPFIGGGTSRTIPVQGSACGVPPTAQAYSVNLAAVPHGVLGYLTAWPSGQPQPFTANLNALTGTVTANAAIVPAGKGGNFDVFASNDTDLVIDINGYFAPGLVSGLSFYALAPCRILDTRLPAGSLAYMGTMDMSVNGSNCGSPSGSQAYVFNATVVPQGTLGYLTLWAQGPVQPAVASLNATDGAVTGNMAIVPTMNGSISSFTSNATHLVLDLFGYFAP